MWQGAQGWGAEIWGLPDQQLHKKPIWGRACSFRPLTRKKVAHQFGLFNMCLHSLMLECVNSTSQQARGVK